MINPFLEIHTLLGLVEHASPSGNEKNAVQWLIGQMKALGYSNAFVDEAGNAVGMMGDGPRQVVLLGHIDTVAGELPVRVEEGKVYGRGSVDAKGPLACFTDAVAAIGPIQGWQFVVIGAVEEERNSEGARFVSTQYQPQYAIIGEPNRWDRIALGYKGSAWADVVVRQDQFHSAHAEQSASEKVIDLWNQVKQHAAKFNESRAKIFEKILLTIRSMRSEDDGLSQYACLTIGARLPVDLPPADWYAMLAQIADGADVEPLGFAIPAYECAKNTRLVKSMLAGIRTVGGTPSFVYKTGTADLNIVAPVWNCEALVYGPGDSALDHTPNEYIEVEEYLQAVKALTAGLKKLIERSAIEGQ